MSRCERMIRAFDLVALLMGREWVTRQEIGETLGVCRRTALRYVAAAEMAGLIEVERGKSGGYETSKTRVRLVNRRLRGRSS